MLSARVVGIGFAALLCAAVPAARARAAQAGAFSILSRVDEVVAPGVRRSMYRVRMPGGPVVAHVVFVDPRERSVHVETALAHGRIGGGRETTLAMARRRHAVAALNGGYYAVGAGDVPLGVLVQDGRVLQPAARGPALTVGADGAVRIGAFDPAQLGGVRTALGAGPMLLRGGAASAEDAGAPNFAQRRMRIPASAVARLRDGRLALVAVDGRRPASSIGMNRAELVVFLRRLGAIDAMLLDSGGSTTLAARRAGDRDATIVNAPSDGTERPVADAILVVSDAPPGPPARLVLRPSSIVALPGTAVTLTAIAVDASGYPARTAASRTAIAARRDVATLDGTTLHVGAALGDHTLLVERFGLHAPLRLRTIRAPFALRIGPAGVNPNPSSPWSTSRVHLTVDASDAHGMPVVVGNRVRWSARNAAIDAAGNLTVGRRNALVTARVAGRTVTQIIPVGWHGVPLPLARHWRFATVPSHAPGDAHAENGALTLDYDFRGTERGAYAIAPAPIPLRDATAVACDVDGDATGETIRLGFEDASGAQEPVTLVESVDFTGKRRLTAGIPIGLAAPRFLRSIYAVSTLHASRLRTTGHITISACETIVPGT